MTDDCENFENVTYLLICQTCGAKFVKDGCGCIVTDCPACGDIASVWTDSVVQPDKPLTREEVAERDERILKRLS